MGVDHYAGAARRWATGAALVYAPIARQLVELCPHSLEGRVVLDAGAGTGVASTALETNRARPVAADFSFDMLAHDRTQRPPATVADISALPLVDQSVDDSVSAFVLNHLTDPQAGLAELVRVTRPGGALLACVYSVDSRSEARDAVDEVASQQGWRAPDWYVSLKADAVPLLGRAEIMEAGARRAGLADVEVDERKANTDVESAEELVEYRFGQAHYSAWLDQIGDARAAEVRSLAADAVRSIMSPYRPLVVFLSAVVAR